MNEADWEQRVSDAWASIDQRSEAEFLALIGNLAAELPPDSGVGIFERAASLDSTGHSDVAVPLYRQALECGLTGERRRRAVIQLASSLRNLGQPGESIALLTTELDAGSDRLDDAVRAFLALALVDTGREREAVSLALAALAHTYPATSTRWPTTQDCSWTRSPDACRRPTPHRVLHCRTSWHKGTRRPLGSRAATCHFVSAPIYTSALPAGRTAWAGRADRAWLHALSTRVSGWMHIQALSSGQVPAVAARGFQEVPMSGRSSGCSGISKRATKRRSRRRPN